MEASRAESSSQPLPPNTDDLRTRQMLSFAAICPALRPAQALPSSEREAHTQSLGPRPEASPVQFSTFPEYLVCARPGPTAGGVERKQSSRQSLFPGSGSSVVPGVPRRKTLQPDKAG